MEKTCKNCTFFSNLISESDGALPYGHCSSKNIESSYNDKNRTVAENWDKKCGDSNDDLVIWCDEDRHRLLFGENFGCIHFEEKIL